MTYHQAQSCIDYGPERRRRIRKSMSTLYYAPAIIYCLSTAMMVGLAVAVYFIISGR